VARASDDGGKIALSSIHRFKNDEHSSFETIFGAYCGKMSAVQISGLGIAIAGCVIENRCEMTNHEWEVDANALAKQFDIKTVILLNDLAASGYGLEVISERLLEVIHAGDQDPSANRILISPGTGLGESIIHTMEERRIPIPTEGGHADFAPFDGTTARLWAFIKHRQRRVSVEDILSGPGINNIYRFVASENGEVVDAETEKELTVSPGAVIANRAIKDNDSICIKAISLFFDALAAECGNVALKALSTGGIYIGGGIVPYVLPLLDKMRFVDILTDKGPYRDMLSSIPVFVVMDTSLPLYGAAHHLLKIADV
jgi:glucokinase